MIAIVIITAINPNYITNNVLNMKAHTHTKEV